MRKWMGCVEPPEHVHPFVRFLFVEMREQRVGIMDMADKSGVSRDTIKDWRKRRNPNLLTIQACLNVLGYDLKVVRLKKIKK